MEKLNLGIAYHGNRILDSVRTDLKDILNHNMNLVVHMFTHNDMKRHKSVMKDIFSATKDLGLDFWVDNWGLGGPPGDVSHILQYFPEAHQVDSSGAVDPVSVCFNSKRYRGFVKEWLEVVREAGGETIFWDEPHLKEENGIYSCCCETCKKLFEERYARPMPETIDDDVREFRSDSISEYFEEITKYSKSLGFKNIVCLMPTSLGFFNRMLSVDDIDGMGVDPYWLGGKKEPYEYVYNHSTDFIRKCSEAKKDPHVWIQTYGNPAGRENEIYLAADAAYDAGARTIISWSFRGGEACDYRARNTDIVWNVTGDAMRRLTDRHMTEERNKIRKQLNLE